MRHLIVAATVAFVISALSPVGAAAQENGEMDAIRSELEALREGQKEILKQIEDLTNKLIRPRPNRMAAQDFDAVALSVADHPFKGQADAPLTLVEYSDYQCPFCRRHAGSTLGELVKSYVDPGNLKYVMKEFPISSIHPEAQKASEAALCAMDQGKYWEMHDVLFANQRQLQIENLLAFGKNLGLEEATYKDCLESGKYEEWVKADFAEGSKLGIRGTPTFLLGVTDPEDPTRFTATKILRGALPFASFKEAIDGMLNPEAAENPENPS